MNSQYFLGFNIRAKIILRTCALSTPRAYIYDKAHNNDIGRTFFPLILKLNPHGPIKLRQIL